jgi:hypothetical protein
MPQPRKEFDENNILLPLYREYPAGLSTGELSELISVSRITGRKYLLELQQAGKIKETGTSSSHIGGEALKRNPKGKSNYNEWRLTQAQYKRMHTNLFTEERYAEFIVKILIEQPVEVPENVDLLVDYGYVENKSDKWKLTKIGIEQAVKILQERNEET